MFSTNIIQQKEHSNVPAFIAKLWHMLSNVKTNDLICWTKDGKSFIIKNQSRFSSELLPMYYKHNNMASFIRQLNKYGFHKIMSIESSEDEKYHFQFAHPDFIKGNPRLLSQIKRKLTNTNNKETSYKNDTNLLNSLLNQVQQLHEKQEVFQSKLSVMRKENDALWREQAVLRARHQQQQKIVNKLIQFLVSFVQQLGGLSKKRRLMIKDGNHPGEPPLMAIKGFDTSDSPLICEVDSNDINEDLCKTNMKCINMAPLQMITSKNETNTNKEQLNTLDDNNLFQINTPSISNTVDNVFLNDTELSGVPLQEVSPAILQIPQSSTNPNNTIINYRILPSKKQLNTGKIIDNKGKKMDILSETSNSKISTDPLLAKAGSNDTTLVEWDCSGSGTGNSNIFEINNENLLKTGNISETEGNENNSSLVVSDLAPILNKEEMDNHLDMVQSDLDILKDILHSDGLSLDASTLMGLFIADDPLSLNLPESSRNIDEVENTTGNEVVTYTPNLIDMSDIILDNHNEDYSMEPITISCDPFNELESEPYIIQSPPPNKRAKK